MRFRQRGQILQHHQPRLHVVDVVGARRQPAVFGQQFRGIVATTLRLGARGEVEQQGRIGGQRGLQQLHLRAETGCWRGRRVRIIVVRGSVLVALTQDRIVEPHDLRPRSWRHDARAIAGAQGGVQLREAAPSVLLPERRDTFVEQGEGVITPALLVARQTQIAADGQIAGVQFAGGLEQLRRLREVLRRIGLRRAGHQRLHLVVGDFRDMLEGLFGVAGEQHVLGGEILRSGVE